MMWVSIRGCSASVLYPSPEIDTRLLSPLFKAGAAHGRHPVLPTRGIHHAGREAGGGAECSHAASWAADHTDQRNQALQLPAASQQARGLRRAADPPPWRGPPPATVTHPTTSQPVTPCLTPAPAFRPPTLARASSPIFPSSLTSPSASTRTPSAHLAASTREILPLNLGGAWPIREAW